ncbi:MAG: glycosyltransferase [Planctomycetia bacterium]|nr:glycosyltransferase [Planctomycetia bacterium]
MKISVIVTSYNYAQYLEATLQSVLSQTYSDWELIVVDDGSADHSVEIIQRFCEKDPRVFLYMHPDGKNHGLAASIQLGLEKASGEWVAFLESDDRFMPTSLEEKVAVIKNHPDAVLVYTNMKAVDAHGKVARKPYSERISRFWCQSPTQKEIKKVFRRQNMIPTFSVVAVKKEVLLGCRFQSPIPAFLDWYLWSQICHHPIYFIDKPLTEWLIHEGSYVGRVGNDFRRFLSFHVSLWENTEGPLRGFRKYYIYFCFFIKFLVLCRKKIIRIHFNRREIILFGKRFSW